MGKVVRKSLPDKVVLLKRPKGVLEDRIVGAGLQRLPQFARRCGLLPPNAKQVLRSIEEERLVGMARGVLRHCA
jgi:hypothetical protein